VAEGALLVLGLGNVLCGDDGAGPAAVARLLEGWAPPPSARVEDGGTLGLALMSLLAEATDVLLVDAVHVPGLAPGTLVRLTGEEAAAATRDQLSVHQVGVADMLDALRLIDRLPPRVTLFGVVPESLELGCGCTPAVAAVLDDLAAAVAAEATRCGHPFRRRGGPLDAAPRPDHALAAARAALRVALV
jgi:hydrogenase maturation protease